MPFHGLAVDAMLTCAAGTAEREAAPEMTSRRPERRRRTPAADEGCDARSFVGKSRGMGVVPHVAGNECRLPNGRKRGSAINMRVTHHPRCAGSRRTRRRIEKTSGWMRTVGGMAKSSCVGIAGTGWMFTFTAAACNLAKLGNLLPASA